MNKQTARELLIDYLYEEISKENKEKLEQYLKLHPDLQREMKELQATRALLQKAPEMKESDKILAFKPKERSFSEWRKQAYGLLPYSKWGKTVVAAAACLILAFIGLSAANLHIQSGENGFSVNLGYAHQIKAKPQTSQNHFSDVQKADIIQLIQHNDSALTAKTAHKIQSQKKTPKNVLTKKDADKLLKKIRAQNEALLADFAQKMNTQNQKQLQQAVTYLQKQRLNDLKLVGSNMQKLQLMNAYHYAKTNQVLGDFIQAASLENGK